MQGFLSIPGIRLLNDRLIKKDISEIIVPINHLKFLPKRSDIMSPNLNQEMDNKDVEAPQETDEQAEQTVSLLTPPTPTNLPPTPTLGVCLQTGTRRSFSHSIPLVSSFRRVSSLLSSAGGGSSNNSTISERNSASRLLENSNDRVVTAADAYRQGLKGFLSSGSGLSSPVFQSQNMPAKDVLSKPTAKRDSSLTSSASLHSRRSGAGVLEPINIIPPTQSQKKGNKKRNKKKISTNQVEESEALLTKNKPSNVGSVPGGCRDNKSLSNWRSSRSRHKTDGVPPTSKSYSFDPSAAHRSRSLPPLPLGRKTIRWVGVNCHEHQEQNQPSSNSPEGSHFYFSNSPTTPHIIISPDISEHQTEFHYPDDLPDKSTESSERNDDSSIVNIDDLSNSQLENHTSPDVPSLAQEDLEGGARDFHFPEDDDGGKLDPSNKKNSLSRDWSFKGSVKAQLDHRISNGDTASVTSVNNSPTDENVSPYFQKRDGQQFVNPGPMPVQRWDNNPRSMSMASLNLEYLETYGRKTRRKSTVSLMRRVASQNNMLGQPSGLLNSNSQMGRSSSRGSLLTQNFDWRAEMNESLIMCISALYGKLLVVMGMAFPIAEVISADVPRTLYDSFYLYLYFGSISFLVYAYLFLLRRKSLVTGFIGGRFHRIRKYVPRMRGSGTVVNLHLKKYSKGKTSEKDDRPERISMSPSSYKTPKYTITESNNHGSMYLKMGACVFGIGSMIYSGLEFGQFFELSSDKGCRNILLAVKPIGRMLFTFLQMYFIFLNSRVAISKHTVIARFGLMHMVATNLCIWLNVLVQETKHEIYNLTDHGTSDFAGDGHHPAEMNTSAILSDESDHHDNFTNDYSDLAHTSENIMDNLYNMTGHEHNIVKRGTAFHDHLSGCRYINLMGEVVNEASPFLFPCTIEYSLLCSGVLYVMWKNINVNKSMRQQHSSDVDSDISTFIARKVRHHYSVDCARASRGLFMGIFVLVLTIISLILFYVLMNNDQFKDLAILEANIYELCIYSVSIVSVIYGMKQMRELEFIPEGDIELDNILLLIAQAGVYVYTSFTIIGGYFNVNENHTLNLMTASVTLIQATLQTLFILDGSRRCCYTADQLDRKPGREMVTFLVVCNLAMWAISTFETSRADVHPTQLHFYGVWAWTILSHVSMPLAIFYRFHVTVCLGEIWKKSYKLKNEFIMNC